MHERLYNDAVTSYLKSRGTEPDRNWRAFLWIATALPHLWGKVEPHVSFARAEVHFDGMGIEAWSTGEQRLMSAARSLYFDQGAVDLSDLASLDSDLWDAIVGAVSLYRGAKVLPPTHRPIA